MTTISEEEENYLRKALLLTGVAKRAVRHKFDREIAPAVLPSTIRKEYHKLSGLKGIRVINQAQWNLLHPRHGTPDSKDFDITLLICLLRNLTTITHPSVGYDCLLPSREISNGADLARIKWKRNYLAHLDDTKIDNSFFTPSLTDVADTVKNEHKAVDNPESGQECSLIESVDKGKMDSNLVESFKKKGILVHANVDCRLHWWQNLTEEMCNSPMHCWNKQHNRNDSMHSENILGETDHNHNHTNKQLESRSHSCCVFRETKAVCIAVVLQSNKPLLTTLEKMYVHEILSEKLCRIILGEPKFVQILGEMYNFQSSLSQTKLLSIASTQGIHPLSTAIIKMGSIFDILPSPLEYCILENLEPIQSICSLMTGRTVLEKLPVILAVQERQFKILSSIEMVRTRCIVDLLFINKSSFQEPVLNLVKHLRNENIQIYACKSVADDVANMTILNDLIHINQFLTAHIVIDNLMCEENGRIPLRTCRDYLEILLSHLRNKVDYKFNQGCIPHFDIFLEPNLAISILHVLYKSKDAEEQFPCFEAVSIIFNACSSMCSTQTCLGISFFKNNQFNTLYSDQMNNSLILLVTEKDVDGINFDYILNNFKLNVLNDDGCFHHSQITMLIWINLVCLITCELFAGSKDQSAIVKICPQVTERSAMQKKYIEEAITWLGLSELHFEQDPVVYCSVEFGEKLYMHQHYDQQLAYKFYEMCKECTENNIELGERRDGKAKIFVSEKAGMAIDIVVAPSSTESNENYNRLSEGRDGKATMFGSEKACMVLDFVVTPSSTESNGNFHKLSEGRDGKATMFGSEKACMVLDFVVTQSSTKSNGNFNKLSEGRDGKATMFGSEKACMVLDFVATRNSKECIEKAINLIEGRNGKEKIFSSENAGMTKDIVVTSSGTESNEKDHKLSKRRDGRTRICVDEIASLAIDVGVTPSSEECSEKASLAIAFGMILNAVEAKNVLDERGTVPRKLDFSELENNFIRIIKMRSGKYRKDEKVQIWRDLKRKRKNEHIHVGGLESETDYIELNTKRSRHNSSPDDIDTIVSFGKTSQIHDSVSLCEVTENSPVVTSGSTLDNERCYFATFPTCTNENHAILTQDTGTEVISGNNYEKEKENVQDFQHHMKTCSGFIDETPNIVEDGDQYQNDLLITIKDFQECLIDESTLKEDFILLSREISEIYQIKDIPEDLISLERSNPPLFGHGYTEEKLNSGSEVLTGTTLSSECSLDINIEDLDSLTDSSFSSFGPDAESILPESAVSIFQDIRVKDKGNQFITDEKTNRSHESQLINDNKSINYARKSLPDVALRNVSQLRNVKFENSYVEESPFQGHSFDFCKTGLNAFTIITVEKFLSTKDKWLEAPFTLKKFDLDQEFYKALPSQKIDFSTEMEEKACNYEACSPFCKIHPSVYDFEMPMMEPISDMNYLTVKCRIWNVNRYIAQDCIMMKTIEKQLQRAKARRRCIIFERLSIDESEKHTIETSRNYSHGCDASFIQRSEDYSFENELKYYCSSKIRLGHTEKSVLLNLDDFMAYMDTCSKEHNNSKETSQNLKLLLRKLNVKNIIASQNATVGCSRKKRIWSHVRRQTLEQLTKQFFKNMETDFPNKSMTPSSKNLYKKIFEYLPFRYEQKIFVFPINGLQQYFEQMSVPVASRPPHAETMKFEWVRVRSYWSFPSNIRVSPIAMARVGFYYTGKCAECRCFSCGAIHREWRDGDDPYVIHQQISPNCFYLNGQESGNVPIHEEDRLKPRHHVDQALVTNTNAASAIPSGRSASAEAIQLPGLSSEEISRIQVPPQRGALGTSQSGDFSFRPQSSQASTATTTQQTAVSQAPSSYFSRPPQASENAVAQSLSLFSATSSSQANTNAPSLSQNSSNLTSRAPSQSQTSTAPASIPETTANIQDPSSVVTTTASVSTTNPGRSTSTTSSSTSQPPPTSLTSQPPTTSSTSSTSQPPPTSSTSQPPPTSSTSQPPPTATAASTSSSTGASSNTTVGSEPSRSRFDPLGINFEKPRYPAYAVLTLRVNTYNGWPSYLDQTPRTMAKAGFFYAGYGDYTRCFFCGGGLRNWEAGDDPWVEHARWFPKCAFLRQNRGDSFVNMVQTRHQEAESTNQPIILPRQLSVLDQGRPVNLMSSIPVQTLREMGKDDTIINEAIDRWRATRQEEGLSHENSEIHAIEIYEVILEIEEERAARPSSQLPGQLSLIQYESSSPSSQVSTQTSQLATAQPTEVSTGAEGSDEPEYLRGFDKILEEFEEQKERLTCKICLENPVAVAFLPCGHLVCCLDCAPAMRKCPVCDELVKGTIKTFFP